MFQPKFLAHLYLVVIFSTAWAPSLGTLASMQSLDTCALTHPYDIKERGAPCVVDAQNSIIANISLVR